MKRYRVGFSRLADAQVATIESWWRENRPAAPEMFRRADGCLRSVGEPDAVAMQGVGGNGDDLGDGSDCAQGSCGIRLHLHPRHDARPHRQNQIGVHLSHDWLVGDSTATRSGPYAAIRLLWPTESPWIRESPYLRCEDD